MIFPTTKILFDRKKTATFTKCAPVVIEVYYNRKQKYIPTGVSLFLGQYTNDDGVCNRKDALVLNKHIEQCKARVDGFISSIAAEGREFSFDELDIFLERKKGQRMRVNPAASNFIEYCAKRINERPDIRETTRKTHGKLPAILKDFGQIQTFADLTKVHILNFDEYLRRRGIRQTTIFSYHRLLHTYINDAMRHELITTDPYISLSFKRGESKSGRFLTESEFETIRDVELPNDNLRNVRNLFIIQCLTGLSYSDLMSFDFSAVKVDEHGNYFVNERRNKTGVEYCAVLLPDVMKIVNAYNGKLPKFSNQQYNMRLKIVAQYAGIDKEIASHWGRRTCGMLLLNQGVSMEIVARVLGHSSIRTTEAVYAKILPKTVVNEVAKVMRK